MADGTSIEWTRGADGTKGATWNPIRARNKTTGKIGWFCEHASDGCRNCYAEGINHRLGTRLSYVRHNRDLAEIFLDQEVLLKPLHWKRPRNIFVCSMTDLFAEFVTDEMRDAVFAVGALASQHTLQVLTKRSAEMRRYATGLGNQSISPALRRAWRRNAISDAAFDISGAALPEGWPWPLPNIHLGVSIESRRHLDRLDDLRATPAAIRWVSFEPLLEDLGEIDLTRIDWVVLGGESGSSARPMHPDWARSIRDQCVAARVAFFFKQWGEWVPDKLLDHGMKRGIMMRPDGSRPTLMSLPAMMDGTFDFQGYQHFSAVGKKRAGAMLDGSEWRQFPQAPQ